MGAVSSIMANLTSIGKQFNLASFLIDKIELSFISYGLENQTNHYNKCCWLNLCSPTWRRLECSWLSRSFSGFQMKALAGAVGVKRWSGVTAGHDVASCLQLFLANLYLVFKTSYVCNRCNKLLV